MVENPARDSSNLKQLLSVRAGVGPLTDQPTATIKETVRRKQPCILVVDDNDLNLSLMRDLLASRGYNVVTAMSADEAWQAIRGEHPDLVLLDVIMPGRSGYDLCRQLKETPSTRLIPVVMVTGLTDRDDRIRGKEAGADEFLTKPFFPEELFARVKSLLRLKEYTDELEHAEAVLKALALSVEARDPYTEGHCEYSLQRADRLYQGRCAVCGMCCPSSVIITSIGMAAVILTDCEAPTSRYWRAPCRWATCTTRCALNVLTSPR